MSCTDEQGSRFPNAEHFGKSEAERVRSVVCCLDEESEFTPPLLQPPSALSHTESCCMEAAEVSTHTSESSIKTSSLQVLPPFALEPPSIKSSSFICSPNFQPDSLQPVCLLLLFAFDLSNMDSSTIIHHPHNRWSSPSSDSELYSVSSPETVSPAPSMDLNCSPSYQAKQTKLHKAATRLTKAPGSPSGLSRRTRRARLKNPSEQRQNASEKEKLRMRDLTKALHHLRTYLPPSVAPVGQTLTKIETLRLTIRYISYLSDQLGLSEEYLSQRKQMSNGDGWRTSPEILGYFQCRSASTEWDEGQGYGNYREQHQTESGLEYSDQGVDMSQYRTQLSEPMMEQIYSPETNTFQQQQCAQFTQSCQVYGYQIVPPAFWS